MRAGFLSVLSSLCLCVSVVNSVSAHPIPNDNHDRTVAVRIGPEAVVVDYNLEESEITLWNELTDDGKKEISRSKDKGEFYQTFLRLSAPVVAYNLRVMLDEEEVNLVWDPARSGYDEKTNVYHFHFRTPWKPAPEVRHQFSFYEENYHDDDHSKLRLTVAVEEGLAATALAAPSEALMERPYLERKPLDGERLRKASATFTLEPASGPVSDKVEPRSDNDAASQAAASSEANSLLELLLDSRQGVAIVLLLAAGFGAVHALTPGHGKTLVAAYLVAERGTVWHALLLGLTTTITHTAAVLVIAAVLPLFFPAAPPALVHQVLGLAGGFLIAALGFWLLVRRLTGRVDHVHLGGGHHHHHDHDHDHGEGHHHHDHDHPYHHHDHAVSTTPAGVKIGWQRLVMLGVSGGIVPCWDAIAMLALAVSANRLWLGLPLLLAFSAGLAGVLIAIGVGVVYARNFAGARWGQENRFRAVVKALPTVSALFITAIGVWLCYDSFHGGHLTP